MTEDRCWPPWNHWAADGAGKAPQYKSMPMVALLSGAATPKPKYDAKYRDAHMTVNGAV